MIYFLLYNLYFHYQLVFREPDLSSEIHMESHSKFRSLVHDTVADSLLLVFGDLEDYTTNIDYFYFHIAGGNLYFSPLTDCTSAPPHQCVNFTIFLWSALIFNS